MSDDPISDIVRNFSVSSPRFAPNEDPRVFDGTKRAFEELAAGGPLEFPTVEWSRAQMVEWWNAMGPAFAGVNAAWAGETPASIEEQVVKKDLEHDGIPVRILTKTDAGDNLPVVVYLHGGGFSGVTDDCYHCAMFIIISCINTHVFHVKQRGRLRMLPLMDT